MSFSGEMVGWQVTFEGPISKEEARELIEVVTSQIQAEAGEPVEFVQIGWSD